MQQLTVLYYGHACFGVAWSGGSLVLDPYADGSVPGLAPLRATANAVYCSHGHNDHSAAENVRVQPPSGPAPYTVTRLQVPHDDCGGSLRGQCTIHIFDFGGTRLAHLGDLGRPLTAAEADQLRGVDCLLVPVGGYYTIDAATAAALTRQVSPRLAIPMHYRTAQSGYDVLGTLQDFAAQMPQLQQSKETTVTLTATTGPQILALRAQNEGEEHHGNL